MRYSLTSGNDTSSETFANQGDTWDQTQFSSPDVSDGVSGDVSAAPALISPFSSSSSPTQVLYLQETGDTATISIDDLHQGQLGDCFLISSIGEIALERPMAITNMIKVNSDGSETVTLYTGSNGRLPTYSTTSFRAISVNVTNIFPNYSVNNGATQDVSGNLKEIWPQVLEKAYATLNGGYASIADGGSPVLAMEELTGKQATWMAPASLTYATLTKDVSAGGLIVMDTSSASNLAYNLVSNHAYMFESVTMANGTPMVTLANPWGTDQPAAIPLSQLSKAFVEIDVGKLG